jgi:hypothetical protein
MAGSYLSCYLILVLSYFCKGRGKLGEISNMHFRKDNFHRMGKFTIELIICLYIISNVI